MAKALTLKQAWIRALESGEFKQTRQSWTRRTYKGGKGECTTEFCCLSVLYAVQHGQKSGCGYLSSHAIEANAIKLLGNGPTWDLVGKNDKAEWTFPMIAEYLKRNTRILRGVLLDIKA